MGKCGGCSGSGCDCAVIAGGGVTVTGSGSPTNPYVVSADIPDFSTAFIVNDTDTLDFSLIGAGTQEDPLTLSGEVKMTMRDLLDVADTNAPSVGDVPVWTANTSGGGWQFQPPPTVAPGTINVLNGGGLSGDGSAGTPLRVATSGIWGVNVGSGDSLTGQPIYVDSAGQLRAAPITQQTSIAWTSITGKPSVFPTNWTSVSGKPTTFPTTWAEVANKPALAAATHAHDDRYFVRQEAIDFFATKGFLGGRAVMDVSATNAMGLRWNGSRIVGRVDNSEWEMAYAIDINAVNSRIDTTNSALAGKISGLGGSSDTVRYARGPDSTAYNRSVSGAGFFAVWMDNSLTFGRNTSSRRYKEDIEAVDYDPAAVLALQPVTYHRIGSDNGREFGMIAEDVNEHVPEIVTWFPDDDGTQQIDGIRYDLLAVAQQAVLRDQQRRIEHLEALVARLIEEG